MKVVPGGPGVKCRGFEQGSTTHACHQAQRRHSLQEPGAWRPQASPGSRGRGRSHTHLVQNAGLAQVLINFSVPRSSRRKWR